MSQREDNQADIEGEEIERIDVSTPGGGLRPAQGKIGEDAEQPVKDFLEFPGVEARGREPGKKPRDAAPSDGKNNDEAAVPSSSCSSHNDICRICHMGSSGSHPSCSSGSEANGDDNRCSSSSVNLGLLVSACRCRGTVGLVHTKCLERWLTESGHTRCELCGYRYATIRVPRHGVIRSLLIWIRTFVATRQMLLDSLYLVVTTPLAVFSAYVCAMTLKMALENRIGDIPWTIVAMLPTCSLTLVAYGGWLLTLQRLHGRRWQQYWQSNFIVQLIPDSPIVDDQSNDEQQSNHNREDIYEDLQDAFDVI